MNDLSLKIKQYLAKKSFAKNVMVLMSGSALAQIILLISSPLLTRLYTPAEFGILAIYLSILSILLTICSLQYELTITLPHENEDSANLVVLSFLILFFSSSIFGVGLLLFKNEISMLFSTKNLGSYLYLLPISLLGIGGFQILNGWAIRKQNYKMISHTKITQSMSMITVQILGGYLLAGPFPLLLGDALGRMSGSSRFVFSILKEDAAVFKKVNRLNIKKMALRYKEFPVYSSFSALIRQISLEIPAILLMFIYGPSVVGSFIIAQRILTLPLFLIGMSVENVFFSEASILLHNEPNKIKELFLKTLKHLFFIILPIMIGLSILSPWLFPMLFGSEWTESGRYVPLLASMYFFQFLVTPFSSIVYFLERQDLQFLREVLRIVFIAMAFTYIMFQQVSSLHAIAIMSAAGSIGFILYGYLSWLCLMQFEKQKNNFKRKSHPF